MAAACDGAAPPAPAVAAPPPAAPPATASAWLAQSRAWASRVSAETGAPPPLQLLPTLPILANPAWALAPSWAATALLTPGDADPATAQIAAPGWLSRALWRAGSRDLFFVVATPYTHLQRTLHRQRQLLPPTLQLIKQQQQQQRLNKGDQQQQRRAQVAIFREIAADQRPGGLRLLGLLLARLFRWLFGSEVYIDAQGLQRLCRLYHGQQHPSTSRTSLANHSRPAFVLIPGHTTHLDYLLLSFCFFGAGLPCPHIAAGKNLALPVIGRLLRSCGAFFIRRTNQGTSDAQLYKSVLAAYVHTLLAAGHHLEFFIEGGRSRDGRVNAPKLGLLRMVVDAVMAGDVDRPVYLVPTALSFDCVLEEASLTSQLAGAAKKGESLAGLDAACWAVITKALRTCWQRPSLGLGAGGYCGRAAVAFGEPIHLQQFVKDRQGEQRQAVAALGEQITASIRNCRVLPTAVLLVGALFAEEHLAAGGGAAQPGSAPTLLGTLRTTSASMDWLAGQLEQRGAAVMRLPPDTDATPRREQLLVHLAGTLSRCCVLGDSQSSCRAESRPAVRLGRDAESRLLQHMRLNQLLPWFAADGLVMASLLAASCEYGQQGVPAAALLDSAAWLRHFLAPEIDTAVGPGALGSAHDFQPVLQRLLHTKALHLLPAPSRRVRLADAGEADDACRQGALFAACMVAPLVATYLEALRAIQVALAGGVTVASKAVCSAAQTHLLALAAVPPSTSSSGTSSSGGVSSRAAHPVVVPSAALVQGVLKSLAAAGVLAAGVADSSVSDISPVQPALQPGGALAAACGGAADKEHQDDARAPHNGSHGSPGQPPRRSFEQRRHRRRSSGSESEEGAVADSVAANLVLLGSNDSDARSTDCANQPAVVQASASGVATAANGWMLVQPEVLTALMQRLAAFVCVCV